MGRKMKDSGVEWIGEIPEEWKIAKIKYGVKKIGSGKTPHGGAETYPNEGILFLRSQNIYDNGINMDSPTYISEETDDEMKSTRVYPNDVLLNITGGSIGRCCIFPKELKQANVNQHVSIIRANKDVFTSEYLHYFWICSLGKNAIDLYQTGGNREGMSADAIKNTYIPYLSIERQQKITAYLDSVCENIDTSIEKTNNTILAYKSLKQSLITQAVTKGIRPNRKMKDSGIVWIGEIPEEWDVCKVKHLASLVTDGAHISPETDNGIYDFISTVNIGNDKIDFSSCLKTSVDSYKYLVATGCKPLIGDVLISKDGTIGKTAIVKENRDFVVASSLVIIRPKPNMLRSEFLNYSLQSKTIQDTLKILMHGAGLKRVSVEKNANLTICLPSIEEQCKIIAYLDIKTTAINRLIQMKEQLLTELESYKKSLIYEYVTGKKEVPVV